MAAESYRDARPSEPGGRSERLPRMERLGAWVGIVAAVLLFVDLASLSPSPTVGTSGQQIAEYLTRNDSLTLVMSYVGAVAAVMLLPFIASLRTFVSRHGQGFEWRWTVALLSGAVAVAVVLVGSALRAAAAVLAGVGGEDPAASALFHAAKISLSFVLVPMGAMVAASGRAMSAINPALAWSIRAGPVLGALGILSAAVIFVDNDWFGPGEPVVAGGAFILAFWIWATAIAILQGETGPSRSLR